MRKIAISLAVMAAMPGLASAQTVPAATRNVAVPALSIGLDNPAAGEALPVPDGNSAARADGFAWLDFSLDRPTRRTGPRQPSKSSADQSQDLDVLAAPQAAPELSGLMPYMTVSYRPYADATDFQLYGGLTRSFGMTVSAEDTILLITYDRTDAPIGGIEPENVLAAASSRLAPDVALTFYGMRGLNAGAPDMVVGTALTVSFMQ